MTPSRTRTAVQATHVVERVEVRDAGVPVAYVGIAGTGLAFAMAQVAVGLDATVSALLFALLLVATAAHVLVRGRRAGRPVDQRAPPAEAKADAAEINP